jgi:hypothetical protein
VISDKDLHYNADRLKQLSHSTLQIEVIHDANHSLSVGEFETTNSINALLRTMAKIEEVIQ